MFEPVSALLIFSKDTTLERNRIIRNNLSLYAEQISSSSALFFDGSSMDAVKRLNKLAKAPDIYNEIKKNMADQE